VVHLAISSNPNVISTWSGQLPPRIHKNATYSVKVLFLTSFWEEAFTTILSVLLKSVCAFKVFLGGVPWDVTEAPLVNAFKPFGNVIIEWPPKKDHSPTQKQGYAYAIFEHEKQVCFVGNNVTFLNPRLVRVSL